MNSRKPDPEPPQPEIPSPETQNPETQNEVLAHWREAGEWWLGEPPREFVQYIDPKGIRREQERTLPPLTAAIEGTPKPFEEDHTEDYVLRVRKNRDSGVLGNATPVEQVGPVDLTLPTQQPGPQNGVDKARKIRDEKVSAACGKFSPEYYEEQAQERAHERAQEGAHERIYASPRHEAKLRVAAKQVAELNDRFYESKLSTLRGQAVDYGLLHCLSGYAFGRCTVLAEEIGPLAEKAGARFATLADPFSLTGAFEFAKGCKRHGVKALIGASFEMDFGGELVLIAQNSAGYRSLSRLITECHLAEPRGHPLANWERLERHSEGLICLTGGDLGPINRALIRRDNTLAQHMLQRLVALYGRSRVFVEVERSYMPWEKSVEPRLLDLAASEGVIACAGGALTHAVPDHFPAQDILICAETLCLVDDVVGRKPRRHETQPQVSEPPARALNAERYYLSAQEKAARFADKPELLTHTLRVADLVEDHVLPGRTELPRIHDDDDHVLREIVWMNARLCYPKFTRAIERRLEYELQRITTLGFSRHFLVANDFCRWSREQGIQLSGRGSVVDAAVSYVLGFSRIDAIRHRLHFDRFLPDDGSKRPDIDIDFEARRRDDVRNYITRKYGIDHVATVAAVGAYCSRGIVREVGKAMGLSDEAVSFLAKRMHGGVAPDQIEAALDKKPELRAAGIDRERFRWVFRLAERLMDLPRNMRCHSSGVVVSSTPIMDTVPLQWSASPGLDEEHLRIIQWDKRTAKHCFDKFDILCLRGQDVLAGTEARVRSSRMDFSVERVPVDDPETYRAMRSGELIGIPQSASPAMRQAHIRVRTNNLDDASLVQAGIRPGVGGAVKINELIARRRGEKPYAFSHPEMENILGNTYGIVVFQEQIDQLLQTFGGYTSGQAEDIRDAIHKRRREDYGKQIREMLIQRILDQGYSQSVAEEVFDLVAGFKGYGFAQGHALAFAEISIRSIYCQQNFPAEYFSALLSAQPAGYYGPCTLVNEARGRGVRILPPDVNVSAEAFTVEDVVSEQDPKIGVPGGGIRVGLMQIHGLSEETRMRILGWTPVTESAPAPPPSGGARSGRRKLPIQPSSAG